VDAHRAGAIVQPGSAALHGSPMPANWKKVSVRGYRSWPARGVFAAGAVTAVLAWAVADARVRHHAVIKADSAIGEAREAIRARLESSYEVIYGAQSLLQATAGANRETFRDYIAGLGIAERRPGIRSVVYAQHVPGHRREEFERSVRADTSARHEVFGSYEIKPPGTRPEYVPVVYVEPYAGNERAVGLDVFTGQGRKSVERARDTGVPVVSGPVVLTVDPTGQPAFNVRLALYRRDMPTRTVEDRRAAFRGIVSATFMAENLVGDILSHPALAPVSVRLYDRGSVGGEGRGGRQVEHTLFERPANHLLSTSDRGYFSGELPLQVGGREWNLQFAGSAWDFITPTDRALPWIVLFGGLLVSTLLAGLIGSLLSSRERAHRLATRITEDLRQSEGKLAKAQRLTQAMIEALPNPIFYKGKDGRYLGVNKAWETFFGIPRSAIIGKTVFDVYRGNSGLAETVHQRDRALLEKQGAIQYDLRLATRDGMHHDALVYKATYSAEADEVAGVIGTIVDITERKQAERRQAMEHAITRVLAEAESIDTAITQILQTICETMGWDYGDHYEYNDDVGALRRGEMWAIDTPEMNAFGELAAHRSIKPDSTGGGLVRRAFAEGKPVWIADITKHGALNRKAHVAKAGLHGAFAFPLVASGHVLGVLEFFHRDVREPDATLIQIAESVGSQIGQFIVRTRAEEAVKFVAMHDALTDLPNRVMFNERLEQAISQAQRHAKRLAVMFIDLDRFKNINDTLGHETGDLLLREVAQRITENLRAGDMIARLGGDEFVVLVEDVEEASSVASVAEKLIDALTENFVVAGREVHVSASIGVSTYPLDAQDPRSLMRFADIAMYRAKEQGRSTFQFYSDQINFHSLERLTLESQLRGALERDELIVHYQPVVDAQSGAVVGMEALVRWEHTEAGLLAPGRFIALAEETGLIVPIGEWVLHTACSQQRKWIERGLPAIDIAVNLSPRQFVHRQLADDISRVLSKARCDAGSLVLEITESTVMHNPGRAVALLNELRESGVRFAIDDFGTGYSSLAYLKRYPIDYLKIDRSFIADVPRDPGNTAITQAIVAMAHSLGLKVIAEGVETREQLAFLREHGCDEVQGFYFSKAVPEAEATALLEKSRALQQGPNVTVLELSRRSKKN
jgi:diguanylate cyclase (GGDEF)-like protein/PAS domain S-box-containing protein